jgi:hypothetical protein
VRVFIEERWLDGWNGARLLRREVLVFFACFASWSPVCEVDDGMLFGFGKGVAVKCVSVRLCVVKKKAVEVQVSLLGGYFTDFLTEGEVRNLELCVFTYTFFDSNCHRGVLLLVVDRKADSIHTLTVRLRK